MPARNLNDANRDFYLMKSSSESNERKANIDFIFGNEHTSIAEISIWYSEECEAWVIGEASAVKGWGPFIYDIAMEWATLKGDGLTCDRNAVSKQARAIWKHYFNKRSDVNKIHGCSGYVDDYLDSVYTKAPITIEALKKSHRWVES